MGIIKGRRESGRHAEGRNAKRKKENASTLGRNQNSKGKGIQKQWREAHREAGGNKREEKKSERLCDSSRQQRGVRVDLN